MSAIATEARPTAAWSPTSLDRCDRCGSQAYVRVSLRSGDLLFCAHHYQQFEAGLACVAQAVSDERQQLYDVS